MNIVCLDLEGVLVPEIWIAFAKETGIPELEKTTRDEPDYDKLMNYRINILKEHGLGSGNGGQGWLCRSRKPCQRPGRTNVHHIKRTFVHQR